MSFALFAACGGGEAPANNAGTQIPTMSGERNSGDKWEPVVDVSNAPTKLHGELATLLPNVDKALLKESVKYGNWLSATSEIDSGDPANATLPVVSADYRSTGYTVTSDPENAEGAVKQEYIQTCRLFIIKAPEAAGAQPLVDKIASNLTGKGFAAIDGLEWADGVKQLQSMQRWSRIDRGNEVDDVYVAYVKVVGDVVIFALESEVAPAGSGPGETQLTRVTEAGLGSRVGGQITFLVANRLAGP